ncbi:MAG: hypothetical protein KJ958_14780 [Gammaproteobacteria bacterium]|nr:hypothetical protein [Gammaproteobacteria bacterium]
MIENFAEIQKMIEEGKSLPHLNEFLKFATLLSIGIRTGQMEELPGTRETIIAAVALQQLMDTKDGRKLLGIRASNKVYNEKEVGLNSPQLEIARRMGCGEITREQALSELSNTYAAAQTYPDKKTLARILDGLVDEANKLRNNLELMLRTAGWDGAEENLSKTLADLRGGKTKGIN